VPNPENLKPFKPGQSGNPGGYSKGRRQIDDIRDLIEEMGLTRKISGVFMRKVLEGDPRFMQMFLDRHDGNPTEAKKDASPASELETNTRDILQEIRSPEPAPTQSKADAQETGRKLGRKRR